MNYWLASFPRSGNTLARLLLSHHFGFNVPSLYGKEKVLEHDGVRHLNADPIDGVPTFIKCHFSKRHTPNPTLLVVRDVRDTLVSYAHYQYNFENRGSFEDNLKRLVADPLWSEFHRRWLKRKSLIQVARYEDLRKTPVQALLEPLTLLLGEEPKIKHREPIPQFGKFHVKQSRFFRKGQVGSWKDEMSPKLEEICWKTHGKMMQRLKYQRVRSPGSDG